MTRRNKTLRNPRRPGRGRSLVQGMSNPITRVPFHTYENSTMSAVTGSLAISVSPRSTVIGALNAICTQFDLWRLEQLEYRLHPGDPTNDDATLTFVPDIDTQAPTVPQNADSPLAAVISPFSGVPSAWVKVPRQELKGMLDWYKCQADAGAAEFESLGVLIITSGLSDVVKWEMRGVMAFKNPVSVAIMMQRMRIVIAAEDASKASGEDSGVPEVSTTPPLPLDKGAVASDRSCARQPTTTKRVPRLCRQADAA